MLAPEPPVSFANISMADFLPHPGTDGRRRSGGLAAVPVAVALETIRTHARREDQMITVEALTRVLVGLGGGAGCSEESVRSSHFVHELFGSSPDGVVSVEAACTAAALAAQGTEQEKMAAVFAIADTNSDSQVSLVELTRFFQLICDVKAGGGAVKGLAATTAAECMDMCDADRDGFLTVAEFSQWLHRPTRIAQRPTRDSR